MKREVGVWLAAASWVVFGLCGSAPAADAMKGKQTFVRVGCFECHGHVGQGGVAGLKLTPDPMPFDAFANFVRTTSGQMPRYSTRILSDDDLADIYAYLASVPKPPDPKSIPALSR